MNYSSYLSLAAATVPSPELHAAAAAPPASLEEAVQPVYARIQQLVAAFRQQPLSPQAAADFEQQLQQELRDFGRCTTQWTYNHLEAHEPHAAPAQAYFDHLHYRRLGKKTPACVSTLFGKIQLWRLGYRPSDKAPEPCLFPLERQLGIIQHATPALVECVARYHAQAGATQLLTLQRLRHDHGVDWGVKKLRAVTTFLAEAMSVQALPVQAQQVQQWLQQATASSGRHKPVLCVGRDGITLGIRGKKRGNFRIATTATLSVYDRRGQRLGTVYLAYTPEPLQATMTQQLTELLRLVLQDWTGVLPRLCYVTDAGDAETNYYQKVLRRYRHPRTGERLQWLRVVDYYHASQRLWTMAEALFGKGVQAQAWARKMEKLLLKPAGLSRVLHSAGALRRRYDLKGKRLATYRRAYAYLQKRRAYLRYADYRRLGVPCGSGVTEAAGKTVYTQRLKQSGMRWECAGAQTVLQLRIVLLSGVWQEVYARVLKAYPVVELRTPDPEECLPVENVAA